MKKIFEERARLVIYLELADLNALTAEAKSEGKTLVEWAREVLLGHEGHSEVTEAPKGRARRSDTGDVGTPELDNRRRKYKITKTDLTEDVASVYSEESREQLAGIFPLGKKPSTYGISYVQSNKDEFKGLKRSGTYWKRCAAR